MQAKKGWRDDCSCPFLNPDLSGIYRALFWFGRMEEKKGRAAVGRKGLETEFFGKTRFLLPVYAAYLTITIRFVAE